MMPFLNTLDRYGLRVSVIRQWGMGHLGMQ